jgi:hypothetical protein
MDYAGAVILFIGASDDLSLEFGETGKKIEDLEKIDALKLDDDKLFDELRISKRDFPAAALIDGKWN